MKIHEKSMKIIVLGRFFESVGLCTSFQLIPMHRELGIDVFVTFCFYFSQTRKKFAEESSIYHVSY